MKINIAKIKHGRGLAADFCIEESVQDFTYEGEEIKFLSPIKATVKVVNAGEMFTVNGTLQTDLSLVCGRCLERFELPAKVDFEALFSQHVTDGEVDEVRPFSGDEISLDDVITEALLLELPLKRLCSESCKGLCSHCGQNLNIESCNCEKPIDPRFNVLADFLKDDSRLKGV